VVQPTTNSLLKLFGKLNITELINIISDDSFFWFSLISCWKDKFGHQERVVGTDICRIEHATVFNLPQIIKSI